MLGDRRFWATALTLCTCVGLIASSRLVLVKPPVFDDPESSLREIASQHLGERDGLEQLRGALKTLPPDGRVIFLGSAADWGATEIYLLTSYLHWPRQVWFVHTGGSLSVPAPPPPPKITDSNNSLFFFQSEIPPLLTGQIVKIGPKLSIVAKPEVSPQ
jgi:hypothetical protein